MHRDVGSLSGGERRRVELAATVAQNAQTILLDEPVNHLDLHYQINLLQGALTKWRAEGRAVVMVMHDLNLAIRFSDHLLCLCGDGSILQGETSAVATTENLSTLLRYPLQALTLGDRSFFIPA